MRADAEGHTCRPRASGSRLQRRFRCRRRCNRADALSLPLIRARASPAPAARAVHVQRHGRAGAAGGQRVLRAGRQPAVLRCGAARARRAAHPPPGASCSPWRRCWWRCTSCCWRWSCTRWTLKPVLGAADRRQRAGQLLHGALRRRTRCRRWCATCCTPSRPRRASCCRRRCCRTCCCTRRCRCVLLWRVRVRRSGRCCARRCRAAGCWRAALASWLRCCGSSSRWPR